MNNRKDQQRIFYEALKVKPMTMKEADVNTGIMRENLCRYVKSLREQGKIALIKKRYCNITKHLAGEYTTNKNLFPKLSIQLKIFDYV